MEVYMKTEEVRILVCDDSILVRKMLCDTLVSLAYTNLVEACNGQEAVEQYTAQKADLVFMDLIMPEKTGVEAIREIKSLDENAQIVVISSIGTRTKLREVIEAGANDFVQKPFETEQIQGILAKLVG